MPRAPQPDLPIGQPLWARGAAASPSPPSSAPPRTFRLEMVPTTAMLPLPNAILINTSAWTRHPPFQAKNPGWSGAPRLAERPSAANTKPARYSGHIPVRFPARGLVLALYARPCRSSTPFSCTFFSALQSAYALCTSPGYSELSLPLMVVVWMENHSRRVPNLPMKLVQPKLQGAGP
jgi:hypothetical protein